MPIHDWSRVDAGTFHDFHQGWTIEIRNELNAGALPPGFFAMAEQAVGGPIPDVITLQRRERPGEDFPNGGGTAVAEAPPRAAYVTSATTDCYARRANRIAIRHRLGQLVAVLEIVSPGNKSSRHALKTFVAKAEELLRQGIHLLVVDLFPPTSRDPQGIHKAIWDAIQEEPFELPPDKRLTVAAYSADDPPTAYVEPVAVGDALPTLPLFLEPGLYVPAPLEATYQTTWAKCPEVIRELVENPEARAD
ncbi:MAG: DUF4058 family protein [Pirellulaceae bacterium]|nr:DUF4058 family protein [Pirellulaceae bacterium]